MIYGKIKIIEFLENKVFEQQKTIRELFLKNSDLKRDCLYLQEEKKDLLKQYNKLRKKHERLVRNFKDGKNDNK